MGSTAPESPLVSIVMPTYNGSRYLRESIDSCLRQTHRDLELIIVNDGSTDESEEIILSYDDPRIIYDRHSPNRGLPRSLNVGFDLAKGDYLTWTSDDNYYADNALEVMLAKLQLREPRVQFVYCDYVRVNEQGETLSTSSAALPRRLRERNVIGACFLYTRQVAEVVGQYNPDIQLAEDYEYWFRVFLKFGMEPVHTELYYYRVHAASLTGQQGDQVADVVKRVRPSALRHASSARRVWERTVGEPGLSMALRRTIAVAEDTMRPRRRWRQLCASLGVPRLRE